MKSYRQRKKSNADSVQRKKKKKEDIAWQTVEICKIEKKNDIMESAYSSIKVDSSNNYEK